MGRIMALDFGTKRTGVAVTDAMQLVASPLETVPTKDLDAFLAQYFKKESVETLVVGLPKRLDGNSTHNTKPANQLAQKLKSQYPGIEVVMEDERFTSAMASKALFAMGASKKDRQQKEILDKISATIILQSYLQRREMSRD